MIIWTIVVFFSNQRERFSLSMINTQGDNRGSYPLDGESCYQLDGVINWTEKVGAAVVIPISAKLLEKSGLAQMALIFIF